MAKCTNCGLWYPSSPGPKRAHLVPLFHHVDCDWHWMISVQDSSPTGKGRMYAYDLEDELGRYFGEADLAVYQFEGNVLYEVAGDGTRRPISTYSDYPTRLGAPTETKPKSVDQEVESYDAWHSRKADLEKKEKEKAKPAQDSFSFYNKPWESVDRKKWPRLWWFYLKMSFLPNNHRDISHQYKGMYGHGYGVYES